MSSDDLPDVDPAIRVHVSPAQASYFAGEQFSVTITFTNTRTPESPKVKNAHKRGAHSISSAPLARPPTSPGMLRSAPTAASTPVNNAPARKRLIGQPGKTGMEMVLEQKRQSLLEKSRSLSIDIPAGDLVKPKDSADDSASRYVRAYNEFSDAGLPSSVSPLTRCPDFQLPPHHPHARKQSVTDVQIHLNEVQTPAPPPPGPASSSTSTFSLALDPIAETPTSPYPGTPLPSSPPLTDSLPLKSRRPAQLGLGHPPVNTRNGIALFSSNSELILYSYAQLLGTVSITPLPGVVMTPDHARALAALRLRLAKRTVVGGGSMDITSHQRRQSHSRSASLTSSLFSLLSPSSYSAPSSPLASSQSWALPRSRTPSVSSGGTLNGVGLGLANGGAEEVVDPDAPLPTFDVPPAMLAVDLMLAPGESRTYTYTVTLPDNLPPTFRGRVFKFSYELVIGTCRASGSGMRSSSSLGPTGANSVSRVMKVPIRVYNHVCVGKVPRPYDMLWPVGKRVHCAPKVVEGRVTRDDATCEADRSRSLDDLHAYGRRLLLLPGTKSPVQSEFEREQTGCREAVEILTRNPRKVSYDVNKDGVKVAVLTFTKSAYRLGETVLGVVELNERASRARVLSLSAMLESQETLPSTIASAGNVRHMRRVHAEHHASLVSSVLRTSFSLDIPSDASPGFEVGLQPGRPGGHVWRVRLSLLVAVGAEGGGMRQLTEDGRPGEWGTSYQAYATMAPRERASKETTTWTQFLVSSFLGTGEREYHDGDEEDEEEAEWREVRVERVECEVPVDVWGGNTAFRALDVVFDL